MVWITLRLLYMPAQIIQTMAFTQIMVILTSRRSVEDHLNSLKCCNFLVHLQAFIVQVLQQFCHFHIRYYANEMQIRPHNSLIKTY